MQKSKCWHFRCGRFLARLRVRGSDVLSWRGGTRSTTGQGRTLLPRQLGAVCDSGQELLRPPLVQVNGHEVCGQKRRLSSEAASQISQCLSLRTDHKLLPHTQMQQALGRKQVKFKCPPQSPRARTQQGPGQGWREWRGLPESRGGLTLQPGVGVLLHVLHRPRPTSASWATAQLLLHLLPSCGERAVRLNQAPGILSPTQGLVATLDPSQEWEWGAHQTVTGRTGRDSLGRAQPSRYFKSGHSGQEEHGPRPHPPALTLPSETNRTFSSWASV